MEDVNIAELKVKIGADLNEVENAIKKLKGDLGDVDDETQKTAAGFSELQSILIAIGAEKAITFLWQQITDCVSAAIEFESALAGVAKTTDLSAAELEQYGDAIKEMGEEIPLTTTELLGISEAAGQLGISGKDNLLSFTETMAKLGTATNMTAEQGATMLAQFANITSMPTDQYENLGSTIVALGNSTATTESQITDMAQGIAAAGTNAGMSESDILALAAAASSVGIEAQAGSTSWSMLIQKIQTAVETGDDLEDWASVAGMTGEEFKTAFQTNAAGAIDSFITGLGNASKEGNSMVTILNNLGVSETRQQRLVQSLANANGLLTKTLQTSNDAWQDNTALNKEAATRFATTESKVQLLKNKVGNLQTTLGNQLNPAFNVLVDIATKATDAFNDFAEENEAVGPLLATATTGAIAYAGAIAVKATADMVAKKAQDALNASMLANPVILLITSIVAATTALLAFGAQLLKSSDAMEGYKASSEQALEETKALKDGFSSVVAEADADASTVERLIDVIDSLGNKTNRTQEEQWQLESALEQVNEICPELDLNIDNLNGGLSAQEQQLLRTTAQQERYKAILSQVQEAEKKIAETELEKKSAYRETQDLWNELSDEQKARAEQTIALLETGQVGIGILAGLDEQTREYITSQAAYSEVEANANEQIAEGNALKEVANEELEKGISLTQEQIDALGLQDEAEIQHAEEVATQGNAIIEQMSALNEAYQASKATALDALQSQVDKWHEIETQEAITTQSIIDGYNQQTAVFTQYTDNYNNLMSRNIDGLGEWIAANNDGSAEFYAAIAGMTDATDEEIEAAIEAWKRSQSAMDDTASAAGKLSTDYDKEAEKIAKSTEKWVNGLDQKEIAYAKATGTLKQVQKAANDMSEPITAAYSKVASDAINALKRNLRTKIQVSANPTSKGATVTTDVTAYDVGGYFDKPQIIEIAEKRPEFVGAADDLESFIAKSVNNAFVGVNPILLRNVANPAVTSQDGRNVEINVSVPISVSKSLSEADIRDKAKMITRVVGKEMATATGGRVS